MLKAPSLLTYEETDGPEQKTESRKLRVEVTVEESLRMGLIGTDTEGLRNIHQGKLLECVTDRIYYSVNYGEAAKELILVYLDLDMLSFFPYLITSSLLHPEPPELSSFLA